MIDNILDFSRIESAHKEYHFEKANLDEVVSDALAIVGGPAQQAGFKIAYHDLNGERAECFIDRDAIMRALVNIIDNAMKYSGESKEIQARAGR